VLLVANLSDALLVGALSDDGVYAILGRAIAAGAGYRSLYLPHHPVQIKYPPGFPFILALLWKALGTLGGVQRAIGVIHPFVVGAVGGLLWWWGRVRVGVPRTLLLLFVATPFMLDASIAYFTIPLSEPWFMLSWAGALVVWALAEDALPGPRRLMLRACAGLLLACAFLFRTQGIVLVVAAAVALAWRRRSWREWVAALAPALLAVVAWKGMHHILLARGPVANLPDEGEYLDWFATPPGTILPALAGAVRDNIHYYVRELGPYLVGPKPVGQVLSALLLVGVAAGGFACLRRAPFLAASVLGNVAAVLLWPFAQDRLMLTILPFGGLAIGAALAPLILRRAPGPARWLGYGIATIAALVLARQPDVRREGLSALAEARAPRFFVPSKVLLDNSRLIGHAARWLLDETRPTDRVMTDEAAGVFLYSGHTTVPLTPTESRLVPSVFTVPGRYLATHILQDSLTWIIVGWRSPQIMKDFATLRSRCPRVLTPTPTRPADSLFVLHVEPDSACLSSLLPGP